jgi:hypothetical protein
VCTYGGGRLSTFHDGRSSASLLDPLDAPDLRPARCDYLAHYNMDHTRPERRAAFLKKVEAKFSTW